MTDRDCQDTVRFMLQQRMNRVSTLPPALYYMHPVWCPAAVRACPNEDQLFFTHTKGISAVISPKVYRLPIHEDNIRSDRFDTYHVDTKKTTTNGHEGQS